MGSGKTTVGEELARRLRRPFFDSDRQIQAIHGVTARELASLHGVERLHQEEVEALRGALSTPRPAVVAAAASVADRPDLGEILAGARVVLLTGDPLTLAQRARHGGHRRPIPLDEFAGLCARRAERLGALADFVVDVTRQGADRVVEEILSRLRSP